MKKIENRKITITAQGQTVQTDYKRLIKDCIENVPQGGIKLDEQRKRIRVLDALELDDSLNEVCNGEMSFEDADFIVLKKCVNDMSWAIVSKEICEFGEAINA
jgi:hypothetical protein